MRKIKYVCVVLMIAVFVSLFSGCSRNEVPDIYSKSEQEAVKMLEDAGFVPVVEYEYREIEEKGKVFKSKPAVTASAKKGSEVVIYISKGPEKIVAKNAYSEWTTIGKNQDTLNFYLPYIDKDVLYIDCYNVILKDGITWQKSGEEGISVAEVSLTKDFEKTIPAKVKYEKEYVSPFEEQKFIIGIPLEELGTDLPNLVCVKLNVVKDAVEEDKKFVEIIPEGMEVEEEKVRVDFNIEW